MKINTYSKKREIIKVIISSINIRIKKRKFNFIVLILLILLNLTFFKPNKVWSADKALISLPTISLLLQSKATNISEKIKFYDSICGYIASLNSAKQCICWKTVAPEKIRLIDQWKKFFIGSAGNLLPKSDTKAKNNSNNPCSQIVEIALLSASGHACIRLGKNNRKFPLLSLPYEKYISIKLQEYYNHNGSYQTPVLFSSEYGKNKKRVFFIFKPVIVSKKIVGTAVVGVNLESIFQNLPNAISTIGGKLAIISKDPVQFGFFLATHKNEIILNAKKNIYLNTDIPRLSDLADKIIRSRSGFNSFSTDENSKIFIASIPIENSNWILILIINKDRMNI